MGTIANRAEPHRRDPDLAASVFRHDPAVTATHCCRRLTSGLGGFDAHPIPLNGKVGATLCRQR